LEISANLNSEDLLLEDWKMAKDRIGHFNERITEIRIASPTISVAIQGAAFVANYQYHVPPQISKYLLIFGALILIPLFALDQFYFWLLLKAVDRAKEIENLKPFRGYLKITHVLTGRPLTIFHEFAALFLYFLLIGSGIGLAIHGLGS
jgi:hypothetical protein